MESMDAAGLRGDQAPADKGTELHISKVRGVVFDRSARTRNGKVEVFLVRAAQQ
jgi:hypothetical protein